MANVPDTSTTLLRDIGGSADNPRWGEFVARYRPVLEAFMSERFPSLDADELIQETFIAIARVLPNYRYVPEEKGHFHNFLTGILRHKALNALRGDRRREELQRNYMADEQSRQQTTDDGQRLWREIIYEIALQQLMANPDVSARNKQIFVRTAIKGEKPEVVADAFSVSRNVVDQTKKRMLDRLRVIVDSLKSADED